MHVADDILLDIAVALIRSLLASDSRIRCKIRDALVHNWIARSKQDLSKKYQKDLRKIMPASKLNV